MWGVISRRRGRASAIPMPRLAELIFGDPKATRRVQTIIHDLVEAGFPIGSASDKPNGYWHLNSAQEYEDARRNIMNRIKNMSRRVKALRSHEKRLMGQMNLNHGGTE